MTESDPEWAELLALATRELRMPLNAVLGWVELLRGGELDAERSRAALETIERNARLQAALIDDLLDLARLGAGKLALDLRALDAAPLLAAAIETAHPLAAAKGVLLERSIDPGLEPLAGDATRLHKVLVHLLAAAIRVAPADGVVELSAAHPSPDEVGLVQLQVRGRGEPVELDGVRRQLVERLVALHGGRLVLDGARAMVVLPRAAGQRESAPRPALAGVRVLVVDDEADARDVLRAVLEQRGAEVRAARSVDEAVPLVEQWRPDLLVSDIGMPGEDGFQLIARVRALGERRGGWVPALALTAYASTEDSRHALLAGFQRHLAKPIDGAALVGALAALLAR